MTDGKTGLGVACGSVILPTPLSIVTDVIEGSAVTVSKDFENAGTVFGLAVKLSGITFTATVAGCDFVPSAAIATSVNVVF